mmetsp:Transcript_22725/g.32062  ORF Transcript_22725/g.32062 Transcript_22725/m.32062 type:complete len:461 (+) Transcript_22725:215-1597(+)|eukprot:CAMPEP_0184855996 /NCGR_PEP_ID=MMETSP0580-20130426/1146_1 /TAXON_ID=1118495 /ORGANISM="Dactyliosolen fragilissimus" /LENGTH=460 /DNA_ID=CAMNT_0027350731 /DNA_START=183 /DNA_END=1565 /DNA_ORIENTATION=-
MKLSTATFLIYLTNSSEAFLTQPTGSALAFSITKAVSNSNRWSALRSTTQDNDTDAAFSAFAESLDEDDLFTDDDEASKQAATWQESLESFLDPRTPAAKRQILLSDLVNANENIRTDVESALRDRKIDNLLTPTGKRLQDGTKAVARQITTDILPGIAEAASSTSRSGKPPQLIPEELPNLVPKIGTRIFDAFSNQARKQLELLQGDLADPTRIPQRISRQTADLATEAKNVFLETPEGLTGPSYEVVSSGDGYEIRDYEGYTVASASMSKAGEIYSMDDVTKGGAAFNTLAAYLFGANDEAKSMEMTTPVTTTSLGEMRFYLKPNTNSDGEFPNPLSKEEQLNEQGAVKIVDVPPARLAVAKFTGFVTEGEVTRQKDALLASLAIDGVEVDVPHGAIVPHVVFQYNPPYTIPIVRRNEVAVPVVSDVQLEWGNEDVAVSSSLEVDEEDIDDLAPSDVE